MSRVGQSRWGALGRGEDGGWGISFVGLQATLSSTTVPRAGELFLRSGNLLCRLSSCSRTQQVPARSWELRLGTEGRGGAARGWCTRGLGQ